MHSDSETKRYYEKHAEQWASRKTNSFHHQKQFERFAALLPPGARVLDIGCAAGIHVPLFLGIGRHIKYVGIDTSRRFLRLARSRYPQLTFTETDILDRKSLPPGRFAGFWAGAVLMHVPLEHWPIMFENIESKMRPGAVGYLSLPVAHPSGQAEDDPRHFTLLSPREQRAQLSARAWEILNSGTLDSFTTKAVWRWYIVRLPKE
jgi:SAM-dependent methyltransferase